MKQLRIHRPTAAMVVACTALFLALGGSAVAALGGLTNGDSLIAKHSLSGNRLRDHTVTGTQVAAGTLGKVPSAHLSDAAVAANFANSAGHAALADKASGLPALTWVPLTLINGWTDYNNDPARTPAIAIDAEGIVHLRGAIRNPSATFNPQFAVLPTQFRPTTTLWLTADTVNATTGRIDIVTTGQASTEDPTATANSALFTSLDGITYPAG
jgi:hypothetical protein